MNEPCEDDDGKESLIEVTDSCIDLPEETKLQHFYNECKAVYLDSLTGEEDEGDYPGYAWDFIVSWFKKEAKDGNYEI